MSKYNWSNVPYKVKFLATEFVAGNFLTWGYRYKPKITVSSWLYDGDGGDWDKPILIGVGLFKGDWQDSLEERPND